MANTLFLKDGSTEIIFHENPTEEFARLIYNRLGSDAEKMFDFILTGCPPEKSEYESLKAEFECYEASLDAANGALNDIYSECDYLDFALKQTRVDRKEAQRAVDRIRKEVENVL